MYHAAHALLLHTVTHRPTNKRNASAINNAGFRLTCCLPHCRFDDDICTTAQAPHDQAASSVKPIDR